MSILKYFSKESENSIKTADNNTPPAVIAESQENCEGEGIKDNDGDNSESTDSSSNEAMQIHQKRRKKQYRQQFKKSWINENNKDWLDNEEGAAKCKACNRVITGGITHINRHALSKSHIEKLKIWRSVPKIDVVLNETHAEHKRHMTGVKEAELKMVMFIAEHNLPFKLLDHLPQFLASVCYDSEVAKHLHFRRKKGTKICTEVTGPENLECISNDLKNNWFSLIIDETTDVSTTKSLVVLARYYKDHRVQDKFLGLIQVQDSTADGLFSAIKKLLQENGIPLSRMIGLAADNASVMQGNRNGVQAKFQQEIPNLFVMACVCHSMALCSSAACKKLPHSVECLARDIIFYFSHSAKRVEEFKEYQEFANLKTHKLLKLSQTRWLSLQKVIDRLLEQWDALILFFTNETVDKDNSINPKLILNALNNKIFKLYFHFLSYILDVVNKINIEFQSETPKLYLLHQRVSSLFYSILRNFVKTEYLANNSYDKIVFSPHNYKDLSRIYCGANCDLIINDPQNKLLKSDIEDFKIKCLDFYIELSKQILDRFKFNDPVLEFLKNFDPHVAVSGECESLVPLTLRFPQLVTDLEKLNTEWRDCANNLFLLKKIDASFEEFWDYVFNLKNGAGDHIFPHLTSFLKGIFSLPHSSAAAERLFSQLTNIKTHNRNKLLNTTCNALLHTKSLLDRDKCFNFKPSSNLLKRHILKCHDVKSKKPVKEDDNNYEDITF